MTVESDIKLTERERPRDQWAGNIKLLRHQDLVEVLKSRNITKCHCDQVTRGEGPGWAQSAGHEMMKVRTKIFMITSGSDH